MWGMDEIILNVAFCFYFLILLFFDLGFSRRGLGLPGLAFFFPFSPALLRRIVWIQAASIIITF